MAVIVDRLEVSYCEGWDPQIRAAIGPVSSASAAGRDRAGEQYAVLLGVAGRPLAVIELAWRDLYCSVRFFDEQLRRVYEVDCRQLAEGRLFVIGGRQWRYADVAQPEFDDRASRRVFEISPDGHVGGYTVGGPMAEPFGGYMTPTDRQAQPGDYWLDVPQFGDWGRFIRAFPDALAGLGHEVPAAVVLDDVSDPSGDGLPADKRPWHPPRPLRPAYLDLLFTAGTRFVLDPGGFISDIGDTVIVEVLPAGMLRMPSGRLIATDPAWINADDRPFAAAVPPGEYPVLLSLVRWVDDPQCQGVAAAKLLIRDDPVASWELALLPDPRLLGDREFFGFGVDAGMACFFDAIAAPAMARQSRTFTLGDNTTAELSDPASGANLIAYSSGWGDGSYPTWIGRTSDGDLVCFIADMLILRDIEDYSEVAIS